MKRLLFVLVFLLCAASIAQAQTAGPPTSYDLRVYTAGTTTLAIPLLNVPVAQVQCGQPKPSFPQQSVNASRWVFDDPANTALACIYSDAARLAALPDGNYEGTAVARNADGTSPTEGARYPFARVRPRPPAAVTGLGVIP